MKNPENYYAIPKIEKQGLFTIIANAIGLTWLYNKITGKSGTETQQHLESPYGILPKENTSRSRSSTASDLQTIHGDEKSNYTIVNVRDNDHYGPAPDNKETIYTSLNISQNTGDINYEELPADKDIVYTSLQNDGNDKDNYDEVDMDIEEPTNSEKPVFGEHTAKLKESSEITHRKQR